MSEPAKEARCRHTYLASATPCPFGCHPVELAAIRGLTVTEEDRAAVAAKSAAMRNGALQVGIGNGRALDLIDQTLAGCKALRLAADGDTKTRFLFRMSCGHEEIRAGSDVRFAHKNGQTLICTPCQKVARKKRQTKPAKKERGDG